MEFLERNIKALSLAFNRIAALAVILMMLVTCIDVILRYFRLSIPGAYETVGLLGAVFASFSLAQTSLDKGHIAVDFFVSKLPVKIQKAIDSFNYLICLLLFLLISWQIFLYALDLKNSCEVSLTLQIPIYPFVIGIAIGSSMLCIVLFLQFIQSILALMPSKLSLK